MSGSINEQFDAHRKWLNSENGDGEQLVLDGVNADQLLNEQLLLLTDAILIDCSFEDIQFNEIANVNEKFTDNMSFISDEFGITKNVPLKSKIKPVSTPSGAANANN